MSETVKLIQSTLKSLSNITIAKHHQKFFKTGKGEYGEGDIFRGIRVPELRKIGKEYKTLNKKDIEYLLTSKYHEDRFTALVIWIAQFKKGNERIQQKIYEGYFDHMKYINNWDLVDISAPNIVGAYAYNNSYPDDIHELCKSDILWEKRIAILATFYYIREGDYNPTFHVVRELMSDSHHLIHKAGGWMLREIGNRDLEILLDFLEVEYVNMPREMLRYAIEKLSKEERKHWLNRPI